MLMRLQVLAADGSKQTITLDVQSEHEAVRKAVSLGVQVVSLEQAVTAATESGSKARFPLLLFSQELLSLLEAGLNLAEAMVTLTNKERRPAARTVLTGVLTRLQHGENFSDVLGRYPEHFPEVYVATIRAAERTGNLADVLARYIAYQLQFDAIRKKLIASAIYPAMLMVVGGFITLFLLGYVVPRFSAVYDTAGRNVSFFSGLLLGLGKYIHAHWMVALTVLIVTIVGAVAVIAHPVSRQKLIDLLLSLPILAAKTAEFRLARFYRASSLLLQAGIPLPKALGMVSGLLTEGQQRRLALAKQQVEEGRSLSDVLVAHQLAGPIDESLIKVGERAGRLAEMLERCARFYDEDFGRWIDWASRLLEPIMMMLIGLIIGGVVVLLYIPILDLAGSLQ
ncbi:type II secretion system F family protein [Andreprevotia chitinilytica]|uniref:type II secretion system F family protein n=1 Tax=Andreprevotia chitinilytica TaxID=396808 RepID=UPI00055559A9|nr:type II secretion system F family protein [Andreprevotia chitinilytica]